MTQQEMTTRINEIKQAKETFGDLITKTEGIIRGLQTEWKGTASDRFADQFQHLRGTAFKSMEELYLGLHDQLTEAQRAITQLDTDMAAKFNV